MADGSKGFRAFILRGSVVDLAIGVVIGAAFTTVVTAVVDLFTNLVAIPGKTNFSGLHFTIGGGVFRYGAVIQALIALVVIAAVLFYFVVIPVNDLMERRKTEPDVETTVKECTDCLSKIPARASRCAFCAVEQPAMA